MKRLVRASRVYGDVVARLDECAVEAGLENRSAADMQRLVMALQDEWDKAALEDKYVNVAQHAQGGGGT
jgi:hypothetical protein